MLLCWTCVSSCVCAPWLGPFRRTPLALHCTEGSSRGASAILIGGCRLYSPECLEGFFSETRRSLRPCGTLASLPTGGTGQRCYRSCTSSSGAIGVAFSQLTAVCSGVEAHNYRKHTSACSGGLLRRATYLGSEGGQ